MPGKLYSLSGFSFHVYGYANNMSLLQSKNNFSLRF